MLRLTITCLLVITVVSCFPLKGNLNADAREYGNSSVIVRKDVILTPGKGGHNFNSKSDSKGHASILVEGKVRGSVVNRVGQEFNAESKDGGLSEVRVSGDLELDGLGADAEKFNALSESGGQSVVQVGNVQVISGARRSRSVQSKKKADREHLGGAWGAVAVAETNQRPWEDEESDLVVSDSGSQVITPVSDLFQDDSAHNNVGIQHPVGTEIHDFPHNAPVNEVNVGNIGSHSPDKPSIMLDPSSGEHGSVNAISKGVGSSSIINVSGSVQI